jgi:hypothetical protein
VLNRNLSKKRYRINRRCSRRSASLRLQRCVRDPSSRLSFLQRSCNGLHTHLTVAEPPHFIGCPQNLIMSEQNTLMYPIASVSHWRTFRDSNLRAVRVVRPVRATTSLADQWLTRSTHLNFLKQVAHWHWHSRAAYFPKNNSVVFNASISSVVRVTFPYYIASGLTLFLISQRPTNVNVSAANITLNAYVYGKDRVNQLVSISPSIFANF